MTNAVRFLFFNKRSFVGRLKHGPLGLFVGVVILFLCLYRIGFTGILSSFSELRPIFLVMSGIILALWVVLGAMNMMVMLRPLVKKPFGEIIGLYCKANMVALMIPGQVGDAVIVSFFRKYSVPISQGATIFGIDKFISTFWYGVMTSLGIYLLKNKIPWQAAVPRIGKVGILIIAGCLVVMFALAAYGILQHSHIGQRVKNWISLSFQYIKVGRHAILFDFCVTFFRTLVLGCAYWFAIGAYGPPSSFVYTLCLPIMSALVAYLPISFNGLGMVEISLVFLFGKIGMKPAQIISAALTLRLMTVLLVSLGTFMSYRFPLATQRDSSGHSV